MSNVNPVVHFEMPAIDKKRMSEFYAKVFNWETKQLGPEMGDYLLVNTTETGEDGFPKQRGAINGGFYQKGDESTSDHPSIVIAVNEINESIQKVKTAGGNVLGEPMEIPGVGIYISFIDTEGNRVSILQPTGKM